MFVCWFVRWFGALVVTDFSNRPSTRPISTVLGCPTDLLQSVGGLSAAAMTRLWSSSGAERASCPKNLRRRDFTLSETGKQPVILRSKSLY